MPAEGEGTGGDSIRVRVRFFAAPRDALGEDRVAMEIPRGTTVRELLELLVAEYPVLGSYVRFVSVAVNRAYVGMGTELHDGDEVACLPPVGGGREWAAGQKGALLHRHRGSLDWPAPTSVQERA